MLLNMDIGTPVDISDGAIKGENRKILEAANRIENEACTALYTRGRPGNPM